MPLFEHKVKTRYEIGLTAQGLIAETFPLSAGESSNHTLISGLVYFLGVGLRVGDVISNVHLLINTGGTATTLAKVGLYSTTGNRLAVSADLGVAWESSGRKTHAFLTPYTVTSDGLYYVAVLSTFTGSGAQLVAGSLGGGAEVAIGANDRMYAKETGQTDLDATASFADGQVMLWAGLS